MMPGLSVADTLHCRIATHATDGGFIASDIFIAREGDADRVLVLDGLINNYNNQKPVQGKVVADTKAKTTFLWKLKVHAGGTSATLEYRLSMKKADHSATITATALGFANTYFADGTCGKAK